MMLNVLLFAKSAVFPPLLSDVFQATYLVRQCMLSNQTLSLLLFLCTLPCTTGTLSELIICCVCGEPSSGSAPAHSLVCATPDYV